jgi:hypothetical protein
MAALGWPVWLTPHHLSAAAPAGPVQLLAQRTLEVRQEPAIVITATVGVNPHECATANRVTVTAGSFVVYCYKVLNSSDITFTAHLITDESLGLSAAISEYILTPLGGPTPTFYFTALIPVISSVDNTVVWTATNQSGDLAVAQATARVIVPSIAVTHTVGRDPHNCADTKQVAVMPGAEVTHCYRVENRGEVTFSLHTVEDSRLGVLAEGWPFVLEPGATVALTATEMATTTTSSTVTWTAVVTEGLYAMAKDWAEVQTPAITVSATVGHERGECAATPVITVTVGEPATFCYTAQNDSGIDFSPQVVRDGLLDNEPIVLTDTLAGYGVLWFTRTAPITETTINSVTWVAHAEEELSAEGSAVAYVYTLARIDVEAFEDRNGNTWRDPEEAGFVGVTLTLETADGGVEVKQTDEDGRLSFMALSSGQHTLTLSTDGLQGYDVKPSMTQDFYIESGRWYSATFVLVRPNNLHLPMVWRE